jgi:NAD(P)-dependent dehydrogenase (short-subunit alcohol dehydrogenase family)
MDRLEGRVALITGAASGIGLGIAQACLQAGMRVAMADVREDVVQAAAARLAGGMPVLPVKLDVRDRQAWITCVERIEQELGAIELLCSNAGVNFAGPVHEATYEDWDFTLGVNLGGTINAVRTVVPRMIAAGTKGHVVLTASVNGLFTGRWAGVYATSKFALVGLGESLRADLAPHGIGVSVLCPGPVQSELFESSVAVRPQSLAATGSQSVVPPGARREDTPIFRTAPAGEEIGHRVLAGVCRNDLYILTHPEMRPVLAARAQALLSALPAEPVDPERIAAQAMLLDTALYTAR